MMVEVLLYSCCYGVSKGFYHIIISGCYVVFVSFFNWFCNSQFSKVTFLYFIDSIYLQPLFILLFLFKTPSFTSFASSTLHIKVCEGPL